MTDITLDRRAFLGSLAAVAAAGAGCLSGGEERPAYAESLPPDLTVPFVSVDMTVTEEPESGGPRLLPFLVPRPGNNGEPRRVRLPTDQLLDQEDPLLLFPLEVGSWFLFGGSVLFSLAGLGYLVDREQTAVADEVRVVGSVGIALGSFDTERADEQLRESGAATGASYERVEETDRFDHYEPATTGTDEPDFVSNGKPAAVAVSNDRVLVARSKTRLDSVIETVTGDRDSLGDTVSGFGRLLDRAGNGALVTGWHGPVAASITDDNPDSNPVRDAVVSTEADVVASVSFDPDEEALTARLATQNGPLSAGRQSEAVARLGAAGQDRSMTTGDGQLTVSGTYRDIDYEQIRPGQHPTDDLPSGDDLPAVIEEAVPDDAVEFVEPPDREGVVRVDITGDFEVDELRLVTVEAGRESTAEFSSVRSISLYSYPNPDGDEIRVIVTVDGVSGIIATAEYPLTNGE